MMRSLALAALLLGPAPVAALEVPSAWWVSHMRAELGDAERVRLGGADGFTVLARPSVDSVGVHRREAPENGAAATQALEPIPWGSIERVEVGHNAAGRGALWGALVGVAAALVYFATIDTPERDDAPLATPGAMAMGAVMGMGIGAAHTRWVPFYPPADEPTGRPVSR